jgi:hypothetical protein
LGILDDAASFESDLSPLLALVPGVVETLLGIGSLVPEGHIGFYSGWLFIRILNIEALTSSHSELHNLVAMISTLRS